MNLKIQFEALISMDSSIVSLEFRVFFYLGGEFLNLFHIVNCITGRIPPKKGFIEDRQIEEYDAWLSPKLRHW